MKIEGMAMRSAASAAVLCAVALCLAPPPARAASDTGLAAVQRLAAPKGGLVFIDPAIRDISTLIAGLPQDAASFVLPRTGNPLAEIARIAGRYRDIEAIHIVSHGEDGAILIGSERIGMTALERNAKALGELSSSLSAGADILLYGCEIALGSSGASFVDALARETGADVAASTNMTGHASFGADWKLEHSTGPIEARVALADEAQAAWLDQLTITVTVATSATQLRNAFGAPGTNGVTYTGTPSVLGAFSSNAYGSYTITGSNLGLDSGALLGTGNITQVPGTPGTFWNGAGTGNSSGVERDRAQLTFQFISDAGVTKIVFSHVMGSEEYNEYVGQGFSDNITIELTGGIYSNTNIALVPGTSTGIDIDTINLSLNSAFYRDNTVASPPVPDTVLDGLTTVINNVAAVVPGTTYTARVKIADFVDNQYNSALFVGHFGSSLRVDLDFNDSSGATAANYNTTFTEGGPAVSIADTDRLVLNYDSVTTIQSATIRLTNAQTADSLNIGALPAGITGSVNTSVPGQITVTLTGAASAADYQTALSAITFNNSSGTPSAIARNVTVVLSDGVTLSNVGVTTITVVPVFNFDFIVSKTASTGNVSAPGTISYTITVASNGDGALTGITISDVVSQGASNFPVTLAGPTGDGAPVGTLSTGETWTYTGNYAVTQANIDNGANLVNTVTFDTAQTAPKIATAVTTITQNPSLSIVKTADDTTDVPAGQTVTYTYVVTNTGNITIDNVTIADVHGGSGAPPSPAGETLTNDVAPLADSTDATANNGAWSVLAPGDSVTFTGTYVVTQADVDNL
jgi:uncharacterized repeat protein (TIGR01451 family)